MFPRDTDQQREWMYNEQVKTNELLTKLIEMNTTTETLKATVIQPVNRQQRKTRGKVQ
jgi:hypothetical protein